MKLLLISLALAGSLAAQEKPKPNWEKMKDCTARADKVVAAELQSLGHTGAYNSSNHYSPKYNRCYVRFQIVEKNPARVYTRLIDAFEGDDVATWEFFPKDNSWG